MAASGRRTADFRLLAALASGATYEDAAESARLSVRTVQRRMADPAFRERLHEARGRYLDRALGVLADASVELVTMLLDMARAAESESVRLGAIRTALESAHRLREETEFDSRALPRRGDAPGRGKAPVGMKVWTRLGALERTVPPTRVVDDEPAPPVTFERVCSAALGVLSEILGDAFETWIRERVSDDESVSAALALAQGYASDDEPPDDESDDDSALNGVLRVVPNEPDVNPILRRLTEADARARSERLNRQRRR